MDDRIPPKYNGPFEQPKTGPTVFEVAERIFGRRFRSDTELWKFVNSEQRDLELNRALLAAGWKPQKKKKDKILLRTADRLFQALMNRLDESNRDTRFAYFVEEVILFGSYLRRDERVTDIDICISYCRKTQAKLNRTIRRMMRDRHVDADEGYKLSVREIDDFLTARHPRFHTSDTGTIRRLGVPCKVIYRIPQAKAFLRLIAATENRIDVKHLHDFLERRVRRSTFGP